MSRSSVDKRPSRRTVMRAFGKYVDYAEHLAKIKEGEVAGDVSGFARAASHYHDEYQDKLNAFLGYEIETEDKDDYEDFG